MKTLRVAVSGIIVALLALGYAGSQWARMNGDAADWAKKMDQPPIVMLSLVLFLGAVVLFFIPDHEGDGKPS